MATNYGDWEIEKSLNEGGQAHIFQVHNRNTGQIAVLKRLKNTNRIERFKAEFNVMCGQSEKLFPKIYDANLDCDRPYYVMEYFEKGSLSEQLIKPWSLKDKVRFYTYLVLAVAYANNEGVIHRDLKPGNILVTDDNLPRVTDFGICYIDEQGERQTLVDEAVGSFRFMAPEMEDGRTDKIGQWTDVYSLGKICYWLFSGKIYNRERHRDPDFDITRDGTESWRYYLNDFLDKVTNHNPENRPKKTAQLILEFSMVDRAIEDNIRYLDLDIDQKCAFCGIGVYKIKIDALDPSKVRKIRDFGFDPIGGHQWLVMCCDRCGNIQTFRKDLCQQWGWKER